MGIGYKGYFQPWKKFQLFLNIPFQIMLIYELILFLFNIPARITLIERSSIYPKIQVPTLDIEIHLSRLTILQTKVPPSGIILVNFY